MFTGQWISCGFLKVTYCGSGSNVQQSIAGVMLDAAGSVRLPPTSHGTCEPRGARPAPGTTAQAALSSSKTFLGSTVPR